MKIIKIEDAYLTIKHYKEPLKKIPKNKGFGFYGCLLNTIDGSKVQCHVCGKLYISLQAHAVQAHKLNSRDYREKFDLTHSTALVSEEERERRKIATIRLFASMTPERRAEIKRMSIAGTMRCKKGGHRFKIRLETKNKRGTCPDQLIAKIQEIAKKMGHTPSLADFIDQTGGQRFKHLIFTTFGSWKNALKIANLQPKEWAVSPYKKRYDDEELLEMLEMFAREHNTMPTATDCKRGLLPSYDVFLRRFGTMENARYKAGIHNILY